jgi:hypothetical protein
VNLIDRAGDLKGMLVDFATSPRFRRELSAVVKRNFPFDLTEVNRRLAGLVERE